MVSINEQIGNFIRDTGTVPFKNKNQHLKVKYQNKKFMKWAQDKIKNQQNKNQRT